MSQRNFYYLGMNIVVGDGKFEIDQKKYVEKLLCNHSILISRSRLSGQELFEVKGDEMMDEDEKKAFTSKVMSLMYLAKRSRPDILKEICWLSAGYPLA